MTGSDDPVVEERRVTPLSPPVVALHSTWRSILATSDGRGMGRVMARL